MSEVEYNVEDGTPPPDNPPAEPAAQPTPEPAPQAQAPQEPEGVEVGGQKLVPLAALQELREQNRQLKEKAQHVDQVSAWYQQNRPYVDFLQANPDLLKPRQAAPEPQKPVQVAPDDDPALVELAKTLDLYTPEGKPDARRASTIRNLVKSEAQTIAQETVKPLAEMTTRERAQVNLREAMQVQMPDGTKPNPMILQQLWQQGDPKVLSTPEGAAAAVAIAIGLGQMGAQPQHVVQPPAQTPVVTEPAGGRNVNRAPITDFEQRIIQTRGINAQKYGEYTRNFKPGEANALESD